jgi:hypothetical protein
MKKVHFINVIISIMLGLSAVSCVSDDYDLSKDVDATVAFGANGLSMPIGNFEKIYLRDFLKVGDSNILDTTSTRMYYLVKKQKASFDVHVSSIKPVDIADVNMQPEIPLVDGSNFHEYFTNGVIIVPANAVKTMKEASATSTLDFNVNGVSADIQYLHSVTPKDLNIGITLALLQPSNTNFIIDKVDKLVLHFPDNVFSSSFAAGTHDITIANPTIYQGKTVKLPSIHVDSILVDQSPKNGVLSKSTKVGADCSVTLRTASTFIMKETDRINVKTELNLGRAEAAMVSGIFDPVIDNTVDPIDINDDLPDFLQGDDVTLNLSNPTLKFVVHGSQIPAPLFFSGTLISEKSDGTVIANVEVPAQGKVRLAQDLNKTFYFCQKQNSPFDPDGVDPSAEIVQVSNLKDLIHKIPDYIKVDMANGHIRTDKSVMHHVVPGSDHHIDLDYEVLVPFQFDKDMQIVYTDSATDMLKDMQKYQADSLLVTADVQNIIPLNLTATIEPCDASGKVISDISVSTAFIPAATSTSASTSSLAIYFRASEPAAVNRIDKMRFRIKANSTSSSQLCSDQYLQISNCRLHLKGQVVADFN